MSEHKCNTCRKDFATCRSERIVFGIDRDPSLHGAEADKVLECDSYERAAIDAAMETDNEN